ncbi:hypothetical protein SGMN_01110 [Stenotrophomonas geniculata]
MTGVRAFWLGDGTQVASGLRVSCGAEAQAASRRQAESIRDVRIGCMARLCAIRRDDACRRAEQAWHPPERMR